MATESEDDTFGSFTHRQGCVLALVLGPVILFFFFGLDAEGMGDAAASSLVVLASMPFIFAPLRRHAWFWVALGVLAVAHVTAIMMIPWTDGVMYGVQLVPIMWLHAIVVGALIWLLSRMMPRGPR